jgi:hypothetical protein
VQVFEHLCGPLAWPAAASAANRITADSLRQWICAIFSGTRRNRSPTKLPKMWLGFQPSKMLVGKRARVSDSCAFYIRNSSDRDSVGGRTSFGIEDELQLGASR